MEFEPGRLQDFGILRQRGKSPAVLFHGNDQPGVARKCLKGKRAAAGKQIEAAPATEVLPQPIEQGFSHPVRGGSEVGQIRKAQIAPSPLSADDADAIGVHGRWGEGGNG